MYELNETELASVVGGTFVKVTKSHDVGIISGDTTTITKHVEAGDNSYIASYNGAYNTINNNSNNS